MRNPPPNLFPKRPPPSTGNRTGSTASWRTRGQQKIDADRATEIQQALIRERYLSGMPSGVWDDATEKAMQRYQGDNGWQNKSTPDARALIKLGLGPDRQHLLNPESAMTTGAQPEGRSRGGGPQRSVGSISGAGTEQRSRFPPAQQIAIKNRRLSPSLPVGRPPLAETGDQIARTIAGRLPPSVS